MAAPIFLYRIFIASPGDLKPERNAIVSAIEEYNKHEALDKGFMFHPVIWEDSPPTSGRPQSHLNRRLRECDFFFLMLWKRWGSPPSSAPSEFSSGTQEEYEEALKCRQDADFPMRDIAVTFKVIDADCIRDPGPQLSSVMNFRNKLDSSKEVHYSEFSATNEVQDILRRCLANWSRDIETDKGAPRLDPGNNALHYNGDRFSLNFEEIEVRAILQVIADFTDLNIVCSDSVRGNIRHLRLKNVPWDQALDVILRSKGLAMARNGSVIFVATHEEISGFAAAL